MKTKTLSLLGLGFLIVILLASGVSAAMDFTPSSLSASSNQGTIASINFVINNTATLNMTNIQSFLENLASGSNTLSSSNLNLLGVPSYLEGYDNASLTLDITIPSNQATGTYTGNLTFQGNYSTLNNYTVPISLTVTSTPTPSDNFCGVDFGDLDENVSNSGKLKIDIDDIDNKGDGEDDEWYPSDEIKVTLDIDNDGDEDIDDISIEYGLWSEETDSWVIEIDEVDEIDINDGKDDTIEFIIDIYDDFDDVDDLEDGDYILYVRALGEVDDGNHTDTCVFDSEDVKILVEDDLVVLDDIKTMGTSFCGNTIQITADILNIGSDEQEDVYIMIHNNALNINERADVGDIDAFDDKKLNFEFTIPSDADEKIYNLYLNVYDEDDDIYENEDDDESSYSIALNVSGNCVKIPEATVYVSLESGGKAGQEIKIKATITNTGDESQTFTVEGADYSRWAELVNISPESITLNADESKDVIITLNVNKDAQEEQNLNIVLTSGDGETVTQPVAVTIEKSFSLPSLIKENPYLWGIGLTSIVLVILIIIVAVRASRR